MEEKARMDLIDTAIKREEEAFLFYTDLLGKIEEEDTKTTILWIAEEEKKHKAFLMDYRSGRFGTDMLKMSDVTYYKIAEYQKEPEVGNGMKSADVYLIAAHRELRSHHFYTELAAVHGPGEAKEMLLRMANEELKHKEKMEYLYTNTAFPQTAGG